MLFWFGIFLLAAGLASFAVDRRATHFFHDHIHVRLHRRIARTTDWAKGAYWLALSASVFVVSQSAIWLWGATPMLELWAQTSLAYLASLAIGSAILHSIKIILGRRRPKDELELSLFGFRPIHFDPQYDSFPSGHALTIFCVAVIASAVLPALAPLWFAIALYLALTRAFLNAHFLSDVFIGSAIGLLTARETVFYLFPALFQPWF
ncbi:MAG TPA: phosphatase PAP2 family protein [Rhizomicrobium sp.]|nr:phosphatase PAP2 family protein [Rhizomicrobium sp.]